VTQGQYATKRFTSIAGTGTTRAYGSQPFNAELALQFDNLSDTETLLIAEAYDNARGEKDDLSLPAEVWQGMDADLKNRLVGSLLWRFSGQPSISSVRPGVSSISVRLSGQRDG
jgi:hypothetical protein